MGQYSMCTLCMSNLDLYYSKNVMDKTNEFLSKELIRSLFVCLTILNRQIFTIHKWLIECRVSIAACSAGTGGVKNWGESRNKNLHFIGAETLKHLHFYFHSCFYTPLPSSHVPTLPTCITKLKEILFGYCKYLFALKCSGNCNKSS